mmetsp:Transcript_9328/g.15188  ORF Transcript_9328/g.15188 Transcript_9328/m.15188 type:complete len:143 (+) Transcript_9328:702-1130(+)
MLYKTASLPSWKDNTFLRLLGHSVCLHYHFYLRETGYWKPVILAKWLPTLRPFFFAGSLGFGVQMLTAGVIQLTNSITLKILSQLRNSLVVLSGVLIYGEVITFGQFCGYLVSICGIVWYSWLEQQKQQAPTLPVKSTENEK